MSVNYKIKKQDGSYQVFAPAKILNRIKREAKGLKGVNITLIYQKVIPLIQDGNSTDEIDEIVSMQCANLMFKHPDYSYLGARILLSNRAKRLGVEMQESDYDFDYFGASEFLKSYSIKNDNKEALEIPSMMYDRMADYLGDTEEEKKLFAEFFHSRKLSEATPIMTNAGTKKRKALISCNITSLIDDSIEGIQQTLSRAAYASKEGAGIGLVCDQLRSKDSLVSAFNGNASGIVRFADMIQATMRFYKQGTRSGSAALYLSLWHRDILDFLELRLPIGDEKLRARDLFLAVIINNNFMDALLNNKPWHLFCPNDIKKAGLRPLHELHGADYESEYNKAVELGIGKQISPKTIWDAVIRSQAESGLPYVFFKDNANKNNMQDNIGTITSLNLCAEFSGVSKPNYTPQCCLGLINLGKCDTLEEIWEVTRVQTQILNKVIDKNHWSDEASKTAGEHQRTIGIGVAGLADFFAKKKLAFTSEEAKEWNKKIFETIYKAAVTESNRLAEETGECYPAWEGSRYQKGETYIKDWSPIEPGKPIKMKNSLLTLLMPSAGGSKLLGVNECFEPFSNNIYVRATGGGEYVWTNKYMVRDLEELDLWNDKIINKIIEYSGSIQNIEEIPQEIKERYKTVWELKQSQIVKMAADRQQFIDMSQSMNLYFKKADYASISTILKVGWELGLKTGVYYLRTQKDLAKPVRLSGATETQVEQNNSGPSCEGCNA